MRPKNPITAQSFGLHNPIRSEDEINNMYIFLHSRSAFLSITTLKFYKQKFPFHSGGV